MPGRHRIRRPRKRKIQIKAVVFAVAGVEPPRIAYRGARGTEKIVRANENPFKDLAD